MTNQPSSLTKVARAVAAIVQKRATGTLQLSRGERQWSLHFQAGQLLYATDEVHRIRRWRRILKQQGCDFTLTQPTPDDVGIWERYHLDCSLRDRRLRADKAKAAIRSGVVEILFSATALPGLACHWKSGKLAAWTLDDRAVLSAADVESVLRDVQKLQQRWRALGLNFDWADRAPLLKPEAVESPAPSTEGNSTTLMSLNPLLNGKRSIWDLTVTMRQPAAIVAHLLHHFVQQDMVTFETLPDLSPSALHPSAPEGSVAMVPMDPPAAAASEAKAAAPAPEPPAVPAPSGRPLPLVACIDDSPQVCRVMEQILTKAGYRFIGIQDSVRAVPILIQHKPDFIFLDLIMPIANGYEVCSQIRRVTAFKNTPIAILTGNDGVIDRVRAKVVGASDFIGKPVKAQKILSLLQRYVTSPAGVRSPSLSEPEAPQNLSASTPVPRSV